MRKILTDKITIPGIDATIISRESLLKKMTCIVKFPLTVITAGAGYGKTVSLTTYLHRSSARIGWYSMGPEDDSVYSFATYLAGALDGVFSGLKETFDKNLVTGQYMDWKTLFYNLMTTLEQYPLQKGKGILVIDDWQYGQQYEEICSFFDRILVGLLKKLSVVIISREYVKLTVVEKARIDGKVLEFYPSDFLFDVKDIKKLFLQEKIASINKNDLQNILLQTEGWAIAVKLLANQCRRAGKDFWDDLSLGEFDSESLFAYLTQDVFNRQSKEIQNFVMLASLVEDFDIDYCQKIAGVDNPLQWIETIRKNGLFISKIGSKGYQFHSLFRSFLREEAEKHLVDLTATYTKIGLFYEGKKDIEKAVLFFLRSKQWNKVSKLLSEVGPHWVLCGRQKLFNYYLEKLPKEYQQSPAIFLAQGHMERSAGNYEMAIRMYKTAASYYVKKGDRQGESNSFKSMGALYLDIIQPEEGQNYLRRAYRLLNSKQLTEKAALLYLMSENMINYGNPQRAEWYFSIWQKAENFKKMDSNNLLARIYLRTGRIVKAIRLLEQKREEKDRLPCSFRESSLILSLCYCFRGKLEPAIQNAQESIIYANKIQSNFATVIGYARLGHAFLLDYKHSKEVCLQNYNRAITIADNLGIERAKTEIYWGLCLSQGLEGNWQEAERNGLYALEITEKGHDKWFAAQLYLSLGASAGLCKEYDQAGKYAKKALIAFENCRDVLGQAEALWQLCNRYYHLGQAGKFKSHYEKMLLLCKKNDCEYILNNKAMLADVTGVVSIELKQYYKMILNDNGELKATDAKPELRVETFGGLKILKEGVDIAASEWRRKAAKQLLMLLITKHSCPVSKEELMVDLWPDADVKSAQGNFKVVFNHLVKILEPERQARMDSKFISKGDTSLQLLVGKNLWLDTQDFETFLENGLKLKKKNPQAAYEMLEAAIKLYRGEYLAGEYLDDFSLRERDRLRIMAIKGAEALAELLIDAQEYDKALLWCDKVLQLDDAWEKAYQLKIICYGEMKRTSLVEKVFRICLEALKNELGTGASYSTENIYKKYKKQNDIKTQRR